MTRLTRVGVLFLARLLAVAAAVAGLIAGALYSVGGLVYDMVTTGGVNPGTGLAFLALPGMPVLFAATGFVLGAAGASLYNIAARWFGGIGYESRYLGTLSEGDS